MKAIKTANKNTQSKKTTISHKSSVIKKKKSQKVLISKNKNIKKNNAHEMEDWLQNSNLLFKLNPSSIVLMNLPGREIIDINDTSLKTFGFSRKEVIGKTSDELNIFIQQDKREQVVKKLMKQGYIENCEMKLRRKDGKILEGIFSAETIKHHGKMYLVAIITDITSRKLAEEAQRENEYKYRTILETTEEGYYEIDLAGNFTFFNDSVCRLLGYSRKELMGMNNRQYMDKETARKVFQTFNKVYRTGESTKEFDWQITRKDGTKRYIEQSALLEKDSSGKPVGFRGIIRDITERRKTEELLKQSEAQYRLLADHMKDQVWLMDLNLKVTYVSPSVEKLLGYTTEEIIKLPLNKILTKKSLQLATDTFWKELDNPSHNALLELEGRCKDGRHIWIEASFGFILDQNGKPISILGEGREITKRKQIEASLQKSEENFRHSLDDSPLGVRISTAEGETIYANKAVLDMYGYDSIDEFKKIPIQERYTPESYTQFLARKEKRMLGEFGPSEYEISIVRKNGEIRHLHVFRKEIFWNGQKQSQVIYEDITLRRQAEEKLNYILGNLRKSIRTTIQVLGTASEARDPYTAGHQKRVADLARTIATEMGLPQDSIEAIRMAGAIHDIGKISIPSEILCKPTKLTDLEYSLVKAHTQYSYEIMKDVESPWPLADIVYQHHERINGSGYPQGLKGENILIEARILAVADVVEAMASYRPYRPSLGVKSALTEIEDNAGILYDRKVVEICLRLFRENRFKLE
ncbi:response regulator/sensory box/hdig domain protein [hydrocarbon metagenome]|uniref:Response regulator/sensory box/hdig domain protein n=1 Tax=hydrocarbon metagenome TaxID=938273 RepID=A0A0W8FR72_9ZZZZ